MASPGFSDLLLRLPPEVTRRSPLACTYLAFINCMMGQMESGLELIGAVERRPAPLPAGIPGLLALMRAFAAEYSGKPCEITDAMQNAPESIPEQGGAGFRGTADIALAFLLYQNGQFDRAGGGGRRGAGASLPACE